MDMNGAPAAHQALGLLVFNPHCSPWVHMSMTTSPILQMGPLRLRGDLSQVVIGGLAFCCVVGTIPSPQEGLRRGR